MSEEISPQEIQHHVTSLVAVRKFPHIFFESLAVLVALVLALYFNLCAITLDQIDNICTSLENSDGSALIPTSCVCFKYQYEKGDWQTQVVCCCGTCRISPATQFCAFTCILQFILSCPVCFEQTLFIVC